MAKSIRGKKAPKARAARKPRQPKSDYHSLKSDAELRISLFSGVYNTTKEIEQVLVDVEKIFNYIKRGPAVPAIPAPQLNLKQPAPKPTPASPVQPVPSDQPAPEAAITPDTGHEAQVYQRKHFDTDNVTM